MNTIALPVGKRGLLGKAFQARAGALVLLSILNVGARADVQVMPLFSSHMVIQRAQPIHLWGTADPAERVTVSISTDKGEAIADSQGKWDVVLPALQAGGPFVLQIEGRNKIEFNDVMVGEVWLASGQSNMAFLLSASKNAAAEIATANHPDIRMFNVALKAASTPQEALVGEWRVCAPNSAGDFSAVAYYFAKRLEQDLHVPIGIIHSSWGGSAGQAWSSLEHLESEPSLALLAKTDIETFAEFDQKQADYFGAVKAWERRYDVADPSTEYLPQGWLLDGALRNAFFDAQVAIETRLIATDPPNDGLSRHWEQPDTDLSEWKEVQFPTTPQALGLNSGAAIWFRTSVNVGDSLSNHALIMRLDGFAERTMLFVNGKPMRYVGSPKGPSFAAPAGAFHAGVNTIAFRVFSHTLRAMNFGPKVTLNASSVQIVSEPWRYRVERAWPPLDSAAEESLPTYPIPSFSANQVSTLLYNAMIAPLRNYSINGAIWYQGEFNTPNAPQYKLILPQVIATWRDQWNRDFAFLIVQLPNFGNPANSMEKSNWARLREVQAEVANQTKNSGMAVTIDVGEASNLHPLDKKDVGERLAFVALGKVYQQRVDFLGPQYLRYTLQGSAMKLVFRNVGPGIGERGKSLNQFWVAGEDQKFIPAKAIVQGIDSVLVSAESVPHPVAVRYAWTDAPENINFYNSAKLPAAPFRTDDWPLQK